MTSKPITRLKTIGIKFNQVLEGLRIREEKGIIPPKFVIKRVIDEMTGFIGGGVEKNVLYTNFTEKLGKIDGLSDEQKSEFTQQAADAITKAVIPAYQKLINYQEALYEKATTDDGVWKFPNGDAFYRHQLKISTTTDLSPDEVHQIGLKEVNK